MVSLAESAAKIASRTRIDSQLEEIRQALENNFKYQARLSADELNKAWEEIALTAIEALKADLSVRSEKLYRAANIVRAFLSKYEEFISAPEARENFKLFAVSLDANAKLSQGIYAICESNTEGGVLRGIQKIYEGVDIVDRAIEEYPLLLPDFTGQLFADLAYRTLAYTDQVAPAENGSEYLQQIESYKRMLSHCARSILWQVDKYERQRTAEQAAEEKLKNFYPDLETYEYMEGQAKIFARHLPRLQEKYPNMYVRFENGEVFDWDEDELTLVKRSEKKCGRQLFFIGEVVANNAV